MELIRIELENFRQFYGKQHIDFSNSGNRNITIIFGENGKGKTGIFRALMFGLFGDQLLEQDDPKGPAVHLVNFKSLEEKRDQVVRSEVSVRFKHNDQMYEIVRSVDGIMNGAGRIEEKINKPVLYKGEQDVLLRNNRITDELQIKNEMNCIFNGKIKKFFLFDGEKIDTLATTSKEARDEVKEAIITMTQINTLNDSINTLRRIKANEKKRINDKNNNYDLKAITNEIETLKEKKENKQSNLNDLKDNLDICLREINEFNEKISNSKELEENRKDINQVKDKIKSKKETLENIQKNIRSNLVDKGSSLLMGVYYLQEKQYLELNTVPLVAKVDMNANTVITTELLSKSDSVVQDDMRRQEYNMLVLPMDLTTGDYIDIRLMLPSGQDYIVVSKKEVEIPIVGGVDSADTIWINMTEDEILHMSCAIYDAYRINGAKIYVTKYTEAGMQNAATPTYPVNESTSRLLESDPNILERAMQEIRARYSENNSSTLRNDYINNVISSQGDQAETNLQTNMEESITNSQNSRQEYLDSLSGTITNE